MLDSLKGKLDVKNSSSQVEEHTETPPPYAASNPQETTSALSLPSPARTHTPSPILQPQPQVSIQLLQSFRFPQSFGIYHASGSNSDFVIALHASNQPIYLISTHGGFSSQPSVILHSSPHESAPPLATADFHSFSPSTDLTLYVPDPANPKITSLNKEGMFWSSYIFLCYIPASKATEEFEWKSSSGHEVNALQGRGYGKKCVRFLKELHIQNGRRRYPHNESLSLPFIIDTGEEAAVSSVRFTFKHQ